LRFSLVVILLLLGSFDGNSQKLLFQKNRYRQALYEPGDQLTFRLKGSRTKIFGQILGFEDSLIVFRDFKINPAKISHLYVDAKTRIWFILRYKYSKLLLIAGTGYLFLDAVNSGEFREKTLIISGTLIGAGLLAKIFISERMKIKGRRKLVIIG